MDVAEVGRTKFDPYVIGNNIRDLREKNDTDEGSWGNGYEFMSLMTLLYNGMARLTHIGAETEDLFLALIYYGTSLLFIVIGNYLPKIKQNNTIGIRIVLTLQDGENWNATHSFSGRIWRASGILLCYAHYIW